MRKNPFKFDKHAKKIGAWLAIVLVSLVLVSCRTSSTETDPTDTPLMTAAVEQTATQSPEPPTATEEPPTPTTEPTDIPTETSTPTPSATPTFTPTPLPPELTFVQNGVCYTGPAWNYDVMQYFLPGETVSVRGANEDESWWAIHIDETDEDCWIVNSGVEESGSFVSVSVLEAPPTPTIPPSETPEEKGVKYYLIDMNSPGPFGCGERMVYIYTGQNYSGSIEDKVEQALKALFNQTDRNAFGFYNPIAKYGHRFKVRNAVFRSDGDIDVFLTGNFDKPTDDCEAQRIHDQVWQTAEQFSAIGKAHIYLNNVLFGDIVFNK